MYSGIVFQDFDSDGIRDTAETIANAGKGTIAVAVDRGIGGVTVSAYDAANNPVGATITAADGTFSFAPSGTGPYRFEFSNLPAGFQPGPRGLGVGTQSGTTIEFRPDGGSTDLNLGLVQPRDYLPNNPTLILSQFTYGGDSTVARDVSRGAVVSVPYSAGSNSGTGDQLPTATVHATEGQVGTVLGLGVGERFVGVGQPTVTTVYAAAYMRKHAAYGPAGHGAIYAINIDNNTVSVLVDLNAVFGAGTTGIDAHVGNGGDYDRDNFNTAWNAVGKTAFGGLAVSPDGRYVYVMNLADRSLYRIPTFTTPTAGNILRQQIPLDAPGATGTNPGDDLRPFAVNFHQGRLYVGIVNSAESTGQRQDLRAYVYTVDPDTLQFSASPIFTVTNFDYARGNTTTFPTMPARWNAWSPVFARAATGGGNGGSYPQPMLSNISFDTNGNMLLGFRDRAGDQYGFFTIDNPAEPSRRYEGVAAGDTLIAAISTPGEITPISTWVLESAGQAVNSTNVIGPSAGATNNQGPDGGEFFFEDSFGTIHDQTNLGHAPTSLPRASPRPPAPSARRPASAASSFSPPTRRSKSATASSETPTVTAFKMPTNPASPASWSNSLPPGLTASSTPPTI